ncbi:conserved protein, unknown function [Hepatocystis sp. ex Piliocolobus tephrosceles]|nr:conserved protein, unknown function [Hepatocystis sp. ex Piliocolobus tephrosceles]
MFLFFLIIFFLLKKSVIFCSIKKHIFYLKCNKYYSHNKKFYKNNSLRKKFNSCLIKKLRSTSSPVLTNKTAQNILCEYNVDMKKKVLFQNLFDFKILDILTIFKLLLLLNKIVLYKCNNKISIKIKKEIKRENKNDYNSTINDYVLFLKKYLLRKKKKKKKYLKKIINYVTFEKLNKLKQLNMLKEKNNDMTTHEQCYKPLISEKKNEIVTSSCVNEAQHIAAYITNNINKKKNLSSKYILKQAIKKKYFNIKNVCYLNNIHDKMLLFIFYVNDRKFIISSFYKKIKSIYYLYRNVLYIEINKNIKKEIAIINLVSNNTTYFKNLKHMIVLNSFYIRYYVKFYLNKFVCSFNKKIMNIYEHLYRNPANIYGRYIGNCVNNLCQSREMYDTGNTSNEGCVKNSIKNCSREFVLKTDSSTDGFSASEIGCNASNSNSNANERSSSANKRDSNANKRNSNANKRNSNANESKSSDKNINIRLVNIYMNGKFYVSIPIVLTYNIIKNNFYLNNLFYLNSEKKYNISYLSTLISIYNSNIQFFQNNNYTWLNNETVVLNSHNFNLDINYILLFYFLYFNKKYNLFVSSHINPLFYFSYILKKKKDENSKIIKKVVYLPEKNMVNFVF